MKCPNCGNKIEDDKLYCEVCGQEISFVPEYEPVIEQSITESLSDLDISDEYYDQEYVDGEYVEYVDDNGVPYEEQPYETVPKKKKRKKKKHHYDPNNALHNIKREYDDFKLVKTLGDTLYDEMNDNEDIQEQLDSLKAEYDLDPFDDFAYEALQFKRLRKKLRKSKLKWVIIPVLVILLIFLIVFVKNITSKFKESISYEHQLELANEARTAGDYASAIKYMEEAISLKDDTSLKLSLSELYFLNNDPDNGILMLWDIISYNDSNLVVAYEKILNFYLEKEDYQTISEILNNCSSDIVLNEFNTYRANPPIFSVEEGVYEDAINLTLTADNAGYIYYTTDGNPPTTDSDIFTTPIYMDLGINRVSAFFVNQYGIKSDIVTKTYTIDIKVPNPPTVITPEGSYTSPQLIELELQPFTQVFYTTDGSVPTNSSTEYKAPIPMPIGTTYFCFVAYSQEGVAGAFTNVEYNLTIDSSLDLNANMYYIYVYDYVMGLTTGVEGYNAANQKYMYSCTSAIELEGNIYYIITESLNDSSGNVTKTSTIYLVDVEDGSMFNGIKDEDGNISRGSLIDPSLYTVEVGNEE